MTDTKRNSNVEQLLQRGLDHYGRNEVSESVDCWRQALELDPSNTSARDYLDSAGYEASRTAAQAVAQVIDLAAARRILTPAQGMPAVSPSATQPAKTDVVGLEQLLAGKRYEEALDLLYRARNQSPTDASISRGIRVIKDRLILAYVRRLGDLEQVPAPTGVRASLDSEEMIVLRLVDGIASLGDVIRSSTIGKFNTYRSLHRLLNSNLIQLEPPAESSLPPPVHRSTPVATGIVQSDHFTAPAAPPSTAEPMNQIAPEPVTPAETPAPPPEAPAPSFDALFHQATEAYIRRDYERALRLFEACRQLRPGDSRVLHNLERVQSRARK
ncbi:MAG: tetratricopeptide repeat protein [Polyangiaceae bacterium]